MWSPLPTSGQEWLQDCNFLNEMIDAFNERVSVMGFRDGMAAWYQTRPPIVRSNPVNFALDQYQWNFENIFPWRRIQTFIEYCWEHSKHNARAYYENGWLINKDYDEVQGILNYSENNELPAQTLTEWRTAAGLHDDGLEETNGTSFRRKDKDDNWTYGVIERGDEIGVWLVEDIRKGLNSLTLLRCYQIDENPGIWSTNIFDCININYADGYGGDYAEAVYQMGLEENNHQAASGSPYDSNRILPLALSNYAHPVIGGGSPYFWADEYRENAKLSVGNVLIVKHYIKGNYVGLLIPKIQIYSIAKSLGGPCDVYDNQGDEFSENELHFHKVPIERDCYDISVWNSGSSYNKFETCSYDIAGTTYFYYSLVDNNTTTPTLGGDSINWQSMQEYKNIGSIVTEPDTSLGSLVWGGYPTVGVANAALGYMSLPGLGLADYSSAFEYK